MKVVVALAAAMVLAGATIAGAVLTPETLNKTTLTQRIVPASNAAGYRDLALDTNGGEPYTVREDGIGTAQSGRQNRRTELAYFGQLSDFQLADEESPARVESLDPVSGFNSAYRGWEALEPQIDDSM